MYQRGKKEILATKRKQQILNAALTVFPQKGFDQASIDDIARAAGIAVGTIYNYYSSKRDILISLISNYVLTEPFIELLQQTPESTDADFLSSIIEDNLHVNFKNVEVLLLLISEIQRDPELRQQYLDQVIQPALKLLEKYLKSRVTNNVFRRLNTTVAARTFLGMIVGLSLLYRLEGEKGVLSKIPIRELVSEVAKLVLEGVQIKQVAGEVCSG
jgi:AcrR family transcriptional regulator